MVRNTKPPKKATYIAVRKGSRPGIYTSWEDCKASCLECNFDDFKKFTSLKTALKFIQETCPDIHMMACLTETSAAPASRSTTYSDKSVQTLDPSSEPEPKAAAEQPQGNEVQRCQESSDASAIPTSPPAAVYEVFCGGSSKGNPGEGALGFVIYENDKVEKASEGMYIGPGVTNNEADYYALIRALCICQKLGITHVKVYMNSNLVVQQVLGKFAVGKMAALHSQVIELVRDFGAFEIQFIDKKLNHYAHSLAKKSFP
jgi:ribonuclease HI